jgi:osmoprotectant transport system ATP-binding protein
MELIEQVGLSTTFAKRYPFQLSGGQQQRVGVARALAADPPIMLMDEPFSAVDPVVRKNLQDEFLRLQDDLGKTIVFVTHDVDEAIKLGNKIAVLRTGGKLAQFDSPENLLAAPADDFVESFLGADRGIRRLSFFRASGLPLREGSVLKDSATGEDAKRVAKDEGDSWVLVVDDARRPLGWLDADQTAPERRLGDLAHTPIGHPFYVERDSLRAALDAAVLSEVGRAVGVDVDGRVIGTATQADIGEAIRQAGHAGGGAG